MDPLEAMKDDQRQILRLAVPSDMPGGLDAARSGHFGRSPSFTFVDIVDDVVVNTFTVPNPPHVKGDHCLAQVLTLGENFVDVLIVAGIGRKPLLACLQAGMRVFAGEDRSTVRSVVQAFIDAELVPVGNDATAVH
jgi:predicted Fe-Mo cluster-binding NifX family protein